MQPPAQDPPRVVIAAPDEAFRRALADAHAALSHAVVGQAATGPELLAVANAARPDVVVVSLDLPQAAPLEALAGFAVVAIGPEQAGDALRALAVQSYLVKPVSPAQVAAAAEVAHRVFREAALLRDEVARLQASIAGRKLIERAKGLLMKRHRWSEPEAFRRLQRGAMNRRIPMAELAQQIIEGGDV